MNETVPKIKILFIIYYDKFLGSCVDKIVSKKSQIPQYLKLEVTSSAQILISSIDD